MNNIIVSIFTIVILVLAGCKAKEKIIVEGITRSFSTEELENIIFRDVEEIQSIKLNKINMEFSMNNEKHNINSTIGIIKDSIIVISLIPALGYEMARIYCTTDSLFIIDRQNKNVYVTRIDEQLRKDSIKGDYYLLQCILMNKVVLYNREDKNTIFKKNIIKENNYYYYTIEQYQEKEITFIQTVKIKEKKFLIDNISMTDYCFNKKLSINYNDYEDINKFTFPMFIEVNLMDSQNRLNLKLSIGNIEINGDINAEMKIPPTYNQIKI